MGGGGVGLVSLVGTYDVELLLTFYGYRLGFLILILFSGVVYHQNTHCEYDREYNVDKIFTHTSIYLLAEAMGFPPSYQMSH